MKYRIIKIAALLVILMQMSSCYSTIKTDRRTPHTKRYHHAGRYW